MTAENRDGTARRARYAIERGVGVHPAALGLVAVVAAWIVTFGVLVVRRHDRFWDVDFDMGIYDQAIWLLAHGREFITVRGLPVFGHHGTFSLLLFVPAYWLGAGANFVNVVQVVVLALGAIPLYLLARERAIAPWGAAALGTAFLLHPALQFFSWELFHPETIAITPLLCAYLCSVRRSWGWFAFWTLLAISSKEDVAIAVAALGLIVALRGDRRIGLATAGLAAVWFVLVSQVMLPVVSGHPAHYESLYSGVGGSPTGILETAFTDPGNLTSRIWSAESGEFAWKLTAPFGLTPILAPVPLLMGLPQFLLDAVSDVAWTRAITYRYAALPLAAIALAMVEGVAFLGRRLGRLAAFTAPALVLACALAGTLAWGPSPVGAEYRRGWWPPPTDPRLEAKEAAIATIPDDAAVSATYTLVPHLSHRVEIYTFPNPWRGHNWGYRDRDMRDPSTVDWIVVDRQTLGPDDRALLASLLDAGKFTRVYDGDDLIVARRVHG